MVPRKKSAYLLFSEFDNRYRFKAARFAQAQGYIPTYPTIAADFFGAMSDTRSNREDLVRKCDEMWIFGKINASMYDQVVNAKRLGKAVRFFHVFEGQFLEDDHDTILKESQKLLQRH